MSLPKPKPFDEKAIADKFWQPEEWDDLVPQGGFLADFILMTRGVETPTKLSLWTAIWVLSSLLKREAYLQWYPDPLFPNFYVFLVGPPKIVAKSTATRFGEKVISQFHEHLEDPQIAALKEVNLLRSKATPESMSIALAPKKVTVLEGDQVHQVDRGSQLSMVVSELSTFLGKQKYQSGLIDRLTDLYDCKEEDDELTIGRGFNKFYNVYFTMIGATTPKHLEESIPEEAFGGGFMSRSIVVFQETSTRDYPQPKAIAGGPTIEDMRLRAAWIAENSFGEYVLNDEAQKYYEQWYMKYKKRLAKHGDDSKTRLQHRFDLHLLKLSLILRAQEYTVGRVIELRHLKMAEFLLDKTYETAHKSIENVGQRPEIVHNNRIKDLLVKYGRRTRRQLLVGCSPYGITADQITKAVEYYAQTSQITISYDGVRKDIPSNHGQELYIWKQEYRNAT